MKSAALFFGRYVYPLPEMGPGATVTLGEAQSLPSYMDFLNRGPNANGQITNPNGRRQAQAIPTDETGIAAERPDLVRALMFHGGFGVRADELSSLALRTIDLTCQLDLRRPMLVAEVEGPFALLRLAGNGAAPKMAQTTLVRVILPLNAATAKP